MGPVFAGQVGEDMPPSGRSLLFPLFSALTLPAAFCKPDLMAYYLTVYYMNQCEEKGAFVLAAM